MKAQKPRFIKIGKHYVAAVLGVRVYLSPVTVFCMLLALAACDLSWVTGKPSSSSAPTSTTSNSTGTGGSTTPSLITSFAFLIANNPSLTTTETATITPPNVAVVLPYSVIQNQTPLTATVTLQSGYALSTPSGAFVPTNGMTLVITNTSNNSVSNYTLQVSVDPNSIAFLQLSSPFYFDTSGNKDVLTSSQYVLALNGATNTYTITFQTDAFNVPYNANVVQNIVTSRPVGFATASVPYGSFTTNLSAALGGTVCPYTVGVQSPNKSITNTFTVQAARTKSNVVQLTDVSATISYIYSYTTTVAFSDSTLSNFLSTVFAATSSDNCQGSDGGGSSMFNYCWDYDTTDGQSETSSTVTNGTVFESTGSAWGSSPDYAGLTTPQAQINSNVASINALIPPTANGTLVSGSAVIDLGTSFTISSAITPPTDLPTSVTNSSPTLSLAADLMADMQTGNGRSGYTDYDETCVATRSFGVPLTTTTKYTAMSYPQFGTIVAKFPLYDSIIQVAPSTLVQSWTQTTNSTDYILTFVMVPATSHITGVVANLQLAAETGTTAAYTIAIN